VRRRPHVGLDNVCVSDSCSRIDGTDTLAREQELPGINPGRDEPTGGTVAGWLRGRGALGWQANRAPIAASGAVRVTPPPARADQPEIPYRMNAAVSKVIARDQHLAGGFER
jgi:hypothetical protein